MRVTRVIDGDTVVATRLGKTRLIGVNAPEEDRCGDNAATRQRERLRWIADLLDRDDHPVVRYEELVLDTEAVARRLGIELDPEEAFADDDLRRVHVSSQSPEASVGRWRKELDPDAAEIINRELRPEIRAVGYEV